MMPLAAIREQAQPQRTCASAADVQVTLNPGDAPATVTVNMVPRQLQLFLDVDRDGVIDAAPAANTDWTWGPAGRGAISEDICGHLAGFDSVIDELWTARAERLFEMV
jgi:hypothetical protein